MPSRFKPPTGKNLAKVDVAEGVQYDDTCTVIEGVVSPSGQAGWPGASDSYEVHCFTFAAWRLRNKPLVMRELTLLRPVPPSRDDQPAEEDIFAQFPEYSIQRLRVLLSKDRTRAVVEKALPINGTDETLRSFSEQLRKPVEISIKHFGKLVLNPTIGWFEGKRRWNRKTVAVHFEKGEDNDISGAVKTAESLWSDQAAWKRKVDEYAVEKLLPLKNDTWLGEDEAELSPKEFKARMKLVSITVAEDGQFEFWHNDGDLFWGHSIQISGNLDDGLTRADIPG
jgi:hypothetical protein